MSDLQELIHKTSMDCIERGKLEERKATIKDLNEMLETYREKLRRTTGEATSIRLMGTLIGLEHAIKIIESRNQ
jgi:hypothetical protein